MALVRWRPTRQLESWRPFEEMERMMSEVERLFEDLWPTRWSFLGEPRLHAPALDLYEKDDALILLMDLPGVHKDDLEIRVENGTLTISGERKPAEEVADERVYRRERWYGRFTRSFSLPEKIDVDHIQAEFKDGVLHVTLPKLPDAKPRTIKIK